MSTLKKALKARELSSFLFLIVLFIIVSLINPTFASSDNISACFNSAVVYILIAVGMAFAIIVGEIDVSVGSNLGFVATVVGSLLRDGCNWLVAFAVGILIGALVGLINGWGVAVMGVPSLIFTLGVNGVLRGASRMTEFMTDTFVDLAMRVALSFILAGPFGLTGVWWSWPVSWCVSSGLSVLFYRRGRWANLDSAEP